MEIIFINSWWCQGECKTLNGWKKNINTTLMGQAGVLIFVCIYEWSLQLGTAAMQTTTPEHNQNSKTKHGK